MIRGGKVKKLIKMKKVMENGKAKGWERDDGRYGWKKKWGNGGERGNGREEVG